MTFQFQKFREGGWYLKPLYGRRRSLPDPAARHVAMHRDACTLGVGTSPHQGPAITIFTYRPVMRRLASLLICISELGVCSLLSQLWEFRCYVTVDGVQRRRRIHGDCVYSWRLFSGDLRPRFTPHWNFVPQLASWFRWCPSVDELRL